MGRPKKLEDIPDCWEVMDCPEEVRQDCPAYPDRGRDCWKLTGTKCDNGSIEKISLTKKIMHCRNECDYYKKYLKNIYR